MELTITTDQVKQLREKTGSGIMECRNALMKSKGDMELAVTLLREKALKEAGKRAGRTAGQGKIESIITEDSKTGVLLELNCETDFVANTDDFKNLAKEICQNLITNNFTIETIPQNILDRQKEIIGKTGENIIIKRFIKYTLNQNGRITSYIHTGAKVGVLLELSCNEETSRTETLCVLAKEICMQIAAYKPQFISAENVPQEVIEQQTKFYENQTREEGKPENVIPKIVEGKLKKYLDMTCLIGQAYIRDENKKISDIVKEASSKTNDTIKIMKFSRYELGEA